MKKITTTLFTLLLALSLVITCFAAEYSGSNAFGETGLTVADDGSFTYTFGREAMGNPVTLLATGNIVDETVTITSIINPSMDNFDCTAVWDHSEIAAEILTLYTGKHVEVPAAESETPVVSGEVKPMDHIILEPVAEVAAGTYTANNDYAEATLDLAGSGSFTYAFQNLVFGNIVNLVASGSVVDGEFAVEQVLNPTMNNYDATSTFNLTELGYQIKSIYLGIDWSTDAYAAFNASNVDPELAARIENSRIPTLIVAIVLLVAILVITTLVVFFKYKKHWPPKGTVVEAQAADGKVSRYTKHQVVQVALYGDTIPVTISADDAESCFAISYTVMGNDLSAEGEITDGEYVLGRDASPMVKNMLSNAKPLMTNAWVSGDSL